MLHGKDERGLHFPKSVITVVVVVVGVIGEGVGGLKEKVMTNGGKELSDGAPDS